MDNVERDALLTLLLTPGLGPTLVNRCVDAFGSAAATLDTGSQRLAAVNGIGPKRASSIRAGIDDLRRNGAVDEEKRLIEEHRVRLIARNEDAYPKLLRHIPDPPPMLYVRGELRDTDAVALAIVGARRCSQYGREQAERFAVGAAQAGLCVVSGGAYGIDAAAHRAALRVGGRTIAVLGSGLARPYPSEHVDLFDEIANGQGSSEGGAVMSELPMTIPPKAENFPRRNRIVSGLALGVLVVEASQRSGALITARLCSEEHNREVMAVPGRVDAKMSVGCHKIIREGWATLVTNVADVLDALGETGTLLKANVAQETPAEREPESLFDQTLTDTQRRIVDALDKPVTLDDLATTTGLSVAVIQGDLTMLQIRGMVTRTGGKIARTRG